MIAMIISPVYPGACCEIGKKIPDGGTACYIEATKNEKLKNERATAYASLFTLARDAFNKRGVIIRNDDFSPPQDRSDGAKSENQGASADAETNAPLNISCPMTNAENNDYLNIQYPMTDAEINDPLDIRCFMSSAENNTPLNIRCTSTDAGKNKKSSPKEPENLKTDEKSTCATGRKPRFITDDGELYFNISHTDGMAVALISDEVDVGVDIEPIIAPDRADRIEKRYLQGFSPELSCFTPEIYLYDAPSGQAERIELFSDSLKKYKISLERISNLQEEPHVKTKTTDKTRCRKITSLWTMLEAALKCDSRGFFGYSDVDAVLKECEISSFYLSLNDKTYSLSVSKKNEKYNHSILK